MRLLLTDLVCFQGKEGKYKIEMTRSSFLQLFLVKNFNDDRMKRLKCGRRSKWGGGGGMTGKLAVSIRNINGKSRWSIPTDHDKPHRAPPFGSFFGILLPGNNRSSRWAIKPGEQKVMRSRAQKWRTGHKILCSWWKWWNPNCAVSHNSELLESWQIDWMLIYGFAKAANFS